MAVRLGGSRRAPLCGGPPAIARSQKVCQISSHATRPSASNFNPAQASKVTTFHNSANGEAWWFYPSGGSNEIDRAVSWNYRDGVWGTKDGESVKPKLWKGGRIKGSGEGRSYFFGRTTKAQRVRSAITARSAIPKSI